MRNVPWYVLLAGALALSGCSGGSSDELSSLRVRCTNGQAFCIVSCDLGCSQTGCSVTEIAENQRLRFKFSDRVDPATVNGSSISIRTATGVAPDGEFLVRDNQVEFVPSVRTVNGISTFGFLRNESYIITLAGGRSVAQSVKNFAGDGLGVEFTCSVVASLGILDENQEPPTVELLAPTNLTAAPVNPTIVLRFSELIDATPLQVSLGDASPIRVVLRPRVPTGECDRDADGVALSGVPQLSTEFVGTREVSVVTFTPAAQLPGNSCITVYVTADLRDLSGRSAIPAQFEILTVAGVVTPFVFNQMFTDASKQEPLPSGGVWGGAAGPGARPAQIGGDGRHGSFDPSYGMGLGGGVFVWDIGAPGGFMIPNPAQPSSPFFVTDGNFYFTDFVVPEGTTIRFKGPVPPIIRVRGQVDIRGTIDVNGEDLPYAIPLTGVGMNQRVSTFNARNGNTFTPGQPGTSGGCGGGRGGRGANECQNTGPIIVAGETLTNGAPGENLMLPAGHAYGGSAGGTGGRGGEMTPTTGIYVVLPQPQLLGNVYIPYFSPGGSGGGFSLPGTQPLAPTVPGPPVNSAPVVAGTFAPGGAAFSLLPYPPLMPPANYSSLNHFVVGGSGGGGGGSHGFGLTGVGTLIERWMAGSGGSGGGGALALRAGGEVSIAATASLQAKGGTTVLINGDDPTVAGNSVLFGVSSPGGGGSGGSFLIQSARSVTVAGQIDTGGAVGSRVADIATAAFNGTGGGGNGSPGFYRLEAGGVVAFAGTGVPTFDPTANAGPLTDEDSRSGDQSLWFGKSFVFPPTWDHYELDVDTDGDGTIDITYTDSGAPGTMKAAEPDGPTLLPLIIQFQGASLNQAGTQPLPGTTPGPWRDGIGSGAGPGINLDSVTGFRFRMIYNRGMFPNMVVRGLRVYGNS